MKKVCDKHQQAYEVDKDCPYCDKPNKFVYVCTKPIFIGKFPSNNGDIFNITWTSYYTHHVNKIRKLF